MDEHLLLSLLPSWTLALRAEHKSPATVKSYSDGVTAYLRWCEITGTATVLDKTSVQMFMAALLESGGSPKTAAARLLALKRYAAWLTSEDEIPADPLVGIKAPKLDQKVVDALTDDQLRALFKACHGKGFLERRDEAIVRLMAETGLRAGELIALRVEDVDLARGLVTVQRGKGGKGRVVPFGSETAAAIDRYIRVRRGHKLADKGKVWLGADNWREFNYDGLWHMVNKRAVLAGIDDFHPHKLRHTAATRWLRAGGSEQGLMAVAGWSNRQMLDRYTGASAAERAAAEARGLNLGNL